VTASWNLEDDLRFLLGLSGPSRSRRLLGRLLRELLLSRASRPREDGLLPALLRLCRLLLSKLLLRVEDVVFGSLVASLLLLLKVIFHVFELKAGLLFIFLEVLLSAGFLPPGFRAARVPSMIGWVRILLRVELVLLVHNIARLFIKVAEVLFGLRG